MGTILSTRLINKLLVVGVCFSLLFTVGCWQAIAYVNDEQITTQEFESRFNKMKAVYELQGTNFDSPVGKKILPGLKQDVLEELIREKLILQEAKKRGIIVSEQSVEQRLKKIKQEFPNEADYQQSLEIQHISEGDLRDYLYVLTIKEKLEQKVLESAGAQKVQSDQTDVFSQYVTELEQKAKIRQVEKFD